MTSACAARVVVVGCGGSGKTVFARRLAEVLDAPVTHLDTLYYDATWRPVDDAVFAEGQRAAASGDRWVIDGNYASTLDLRLARATEVVLLDLPPLVRLARIVRRRWKYRGGQHPGDGVFDRITPGFVRYITTYRARMRPRVLDTVRRHDPSTRLTILSSRRAVERYLVDVARA